MFHFLSEIHVNALINGGGFNNRILPLSERHLVLKRVSETQYSVYLPLHDLILGATPTPIPIAEKAKPNHDNVLPLMSQAVWQYLREMSKSIEFNRHERVNDPVHVVNQATQLYEADSLPLLRFVDFELPSAPILDENSYYTEYDLSIHINPNLLRILNVQRNAKHGSRDLNMTLDGLNQSLMNMTQEQIEAIMSLEDVIYIGKENKHHTHIMDTNLNVNVIPQSDYIEHGFFNLVPIAPLKINFDIEHDLQQVEVKLNTMENATDNHSVQNTVKQFEEHLQVYANRLQHGYLSKMMRIINNKYLFDTESFPYMPFVVKNFEYQVDLIPTSEAIQFLFDLLLTHIDYQNPNQQLPLLVTQLLHLKRMSMKEPHIYIHFPENISISVQNDKLYVNIPKAIWYAYQSKATRNENLFINAMEHAYNQALHNEDATFEIEQWQSNPFGSLLFSFAIDNGGLVLQPLNEMDEPFLTGKQNLDALDVFNGLKKDVQAECWQQCVQLIDKEIANINPNWHFNMDDSQYGQLSANEKQQYCAFVQNLLDKQDLTNLIKSCKTS